MSFDDRLFDDRLSTDKFCLSMIVLSMTKTTRLENWKEERYTICRYYRKDNDYDLENKIMSQIDFIQLFLLMNGLHMTHLKIIIEIGLHIRLVIQEMLRF